MKVRLARILVGTLGFILAMPLMVVPPPGLETWAPWLAILALLLKVALGMLVLLKSLDLYRQAAFPPDSAALDDPVARWLAEKQEALRRRSWFFVLLLDLLILFVPLLMGFFLLAVLLRPFYVTLQQQPPSLEFLRQEGTLTLTFVLATLKGLFILTASTLLGAGLALMTLAFLLYRVS